MHLSQPSREPKLLPVAEVMGNALARRWHGSATGRDDAVDLDALGVKA